MQLRTKHILIGIGIIFATLVILFVGIFGFAIFVLLSHGGPFILPQDCGGRETVVHVVVNNTERLPIENAEVNAQVWDGMSDTIIETGFTDSDGSYTHSMHAFICAGVTIEVHAAGYEPFLRRLDVYETSEYDLNVELHRVRP